MINTSTSIITKLESYESIYASYAPQKKHSLAYKVHNWIGLLINAHFLRVFDLSDLISLNDKMEAFVREMKVDLDMVYINYEDHVCPAFIHRFSALKYSGPLEKYHAMVIETLKIMIFRAETDANQEKIENHLLKLLKSKINEFNPPVKKNILFSHKVEAPPKFSEYNVKEYIKRQIDISLDK